MPNCCDPFTSLSLYPVLNAGPFHHESEWRAPNGWFRSLSKFDDLFLVIKFKGVRQRSPSIDFAPGLRQTFKQHWYNEHCIASTVIDIWNSYVITTHALRITFPSESGSEIFSCNAKIIQPKMQPLATTRRMMMWLAMCSADESSSESQKEAYLAHALAVFLLNLIGFTASLAFSFKYVKTDFDSAMFAPMTTIGEFGLIYFMVVAILMRHQIENIFTSLSTMYKSSNFNHWC